MPKEKLFKTGSKTMSIRVPDYFSKEQMSYLRKRFQSDVMMMAKSITDSTRIELLKKQNLTEEDVNKVKKLESDLLKSLYSEEVIPIENTKEVIHEDIKEEVIPIKDTEKVIQEEITNDDMDSELDISKYKNVGKIITDKSLSIEKKTELIDKYMKSKK